MKKKTGNGSEKEEKWPETVVCYVTYISMEYACMKRSVKELDILLATSEF